ncbi:replication initiation factor domain-containing protein, partial [Pseudomonas sp.]|uniref:replication initiation factor domain-containing protein n=1 Tax=Pseudomonas sp. TaxID=306 RepID=UPI00258292B5
MFDSLSGELIRYAQVNRLSINQQGDWVRGEARTLYVGSKDSPVRLVLYEKGYEQGGTAPKDWVRLEVRIRPKKDWRERVARWDADTVFCAGWVPDALRALGWDDLVKRTIGTVWKPSDAERARTALC